MSRHTPEQIADAREWFDENELAQLSVKYGDASARHIRTLLALAAPPTDEAIRAALLELWGTPEFYYEEDRSKIVIAVIRKLFGPVKP